MAEVLVLVDHAGGTVRKTTTELLTLARRLGEPSAVFIGEGYEEAKATLGAYGAQKIYRSDSADLIDYLVVPNWYYATPTGMAKYPTLMEARRHAVVVARFGSGDDGVRIYRVSRYWRPG